MMETHTVRPEDLISLRTALCESLEQFGKTLKRAIEPNATFYYSKYYIYRMEHGKDPIPNHIAQAFWIVAGQFDQVIPGSAGMTEVVVMALATQIPTGSVIPRGAKVIKCATPGCPVRFLRVHPRQKYHDPDCHHRARRSQK